MSRQLTINARFKVDDESGVREQVPSVCCPGGGKGYQPWCRNENRMASTRSFAALLFVCFVACAQNRTSSLAPTPKILIHNGNFARWDGGAGGGPSEWAYGRRYVAAGDVRRVRYGGRSAIKLTASKERWDGRWHLAQVEQTLASSNGRLRVKLQPETDYVGNAYPRSIVGVQLADDVGHQRYYAIDSKLKQPRSYHRDGVSVYVYPGQLGKTNVLDLDLGSLPNDAFISRSDRPMKLVLISAYTDDQYVRGRASGVFSEVRGE